MSTIVTRAGKGSPLTNTELDSNFTNLNTDKAELSGANFTGSINVTGNVTIPTGNKIAFDTDGLTYITEDQDERLRVWVANTEFIRMTNTTTDELRLLPYGGNLFSGGNLDVTGSVVADGLTANGASEGDTYFTGGTASSRLLNVFTSTHNGGANAGHNFKIASGQGAFIFGNNTTANLLTVKSGGIDVTGTATMDGLTVDGNTTFNTSSTLFANLNYSGSNLGKFSTDGVNLNVEATSNLFLKVNSATRAKLDGNGDISFYDGSGNQGFFFDSSTSRLGLGTTAPNTNVQIYHATDDVSINVNHGTGGSYPKKSGISFGAISTSLGGDTTFTGGAGIQVINTAAANAPTEMLFFTTSGGAPTERFKINADGSSVFSGSVTSTGLNVTSNTPVLTFTESDQSKEYQIGSYGAAFAVFDATANAFRYVIDTSGNVGIGVSDPDVKLEVSGSARFAQENHSWTFDDTINNRLGFVKKAGNYPVLSSASGIPIIFSTSDNSNLSSSVASQTLTERTRIASNGTLYHGKTADSLNTGGLQTLISGQTSITQSYTEPLRLNRMSSQGAIQKFYYNGGEVGSIGSYGGHPYIGGDNAGNATFLRFWTGSTPSVRPSTNSGTNADNTLDLGSSAARFKDLYLSNNATAQKLTLTKAPVGLFTIEVDGTNTGQPNLIVKKSTSEALRIDNNNNLLVGTSNTTWQSQEGLRYFSGNSLIVTRDSDEPMSLNRLTNDGDLLILRKNGTSVGSIGSVSNGKLMIGASDTNLIFADQFDEIYPSQNGVTTLGDPGARFKDLHLSGVANIGGTAKFASWSNSGASNGIEIRSADSQILNSHTGTSLHVYQYFYNANGIVGSISASGSATAYNTSSDYRLKENVVAMSGATERLKQLEPKRFNFIADADATVDGFLAHEVADVVPEAITGTKDAMKDEEYEVTPAVLDDEGNVTTEAVMGTRSVPDYQGIDQSKLVPLLVATIQELEARITKLENN